MSQKPPRLTTILLVEPDDIVRPILKENLRRWGYTVIVSLDAVDAFERTRDGGASFDLILLNQFEHSIDESLEIGRYIRQQATLSGPIPVVILAEGYGVELEGQNIQVGEREYVTYLEDGEQLRKLLYRLCPLQPS